MALPPVATYAARSHDSWLLVAGACPARLLLSTPTPAANTQSSVAPSFHPYPLAQDYVQLDAAIRAGKVLYVGEVKRVLGETSVVDLECKLLKIRWAGRPVGRRAGSRSRA